jgi:hypothetical protein
LLHVIIKGIFDERIPLMITPLLDLNELFVLASADPVFEKLIKAVHHPENFVMRLKHKWFVRGYLPKQLEKLQQDTGVQIDRTMNGYSVIPPGPETAHLNKHFDAVDKGRVQDILQKTHSALTPSPPTKNKEIDDLKASLKEIMDQLQVPLPVPAPAKKSKIRRQPAP